MATAAAPVMPPASWRRPGVPAHIKAACALANRLWKGSRCKVEAKPRMGLSFNEATAVGEEMVQ